MSSQLHDPFVGLVTSLNTYVLDVIRNKPLSPRHCYLFHPNAHRLFQYLFAVATESECSVIPVRLAFRNIHHRRNYSPYSFTYDRAKPFTMYLVEDVDDVARYRSMENPHGAIRDLYDTAVHELCQLALQENVFIVAVGSARTPADVDSPLLRRLSFRSFCPVPYEFTDNARWHEFVDGWHDRSETWPFSDDHARARAV